MYLYSALQCHAILSVGKGVGDNWLADQERDAKLERWKWGGKEVGRRGENRSHLIRDGEELGDGYLCMG